MCAMGEAESFVSEKFARKLPEGRGRIFELPKARSCTVLCMYVYTAVCIYIVCVDVESGTNSFFCSTWR